MASVATPEADERELTRIEYDDSISRWFVWASVIFGIVGMLVGVIIALQLAWWPANIGRYLTFGRLRPLHTNAVIFAFVGNMMFAGIYYSTQRLLKVRMASDVLSKIHFWGWQLIIVAAAVTLPLGITTGKEYAELEWPIDIAIAVIWVVFAINFFWTLARRNEKHLYVALWFYISAIITVAVLHIVNSLEIPVTALHSYSIYGGAQDALVQWWYGHNAVAFFLTTPILGIMYYYLPKAADRPVYSYRLSIIHFWALVFVYIWAGPHHLLYTALPDWAQTLGMIFSVMLWAPSWGGMLNGLLTLRGAWDKVRSDPVLKFFAAGVTFYGMATFEGPLLSIKSVSGVAHYTDWIIGHVHSGALGWNGFMAAGMFYWMVPRLYGTQLKSKAMAEVHFYMATAGILLYIVAMWVSGITQGMMLRAVDSHGHLAYRNFLDTLNAIRPMYWMRLFGGLLYLTGFVLMAVNLLQTALSGKAVNGEVKVLVAKKKAPEEATWSQVVFGRPVVVVLLSGVLIGSLAVVNDAASVMMSILGVGMAVGGTIALQLTREKGKPNWHRLLEGRAMIFTVFVTIAVLIGGIAEIIPSILTQHAVPARQGGQVPYSALELEGRDIYVREGCYLCHSQMIRPFVVESQRYGAVSRIGDSQYDHPFQWGSRRTGPDLAREGGRNPNSWHYRHLLDPRSTSNGMSIMPSYPSLATTMIDFDRTPDKLLAMQIIGVPYTDRQIARSVASARRQANGIVSDLRTAGIRAVPNSEIVALIAYLQRLGRGPQDTTTAPVAAATR